MKILAFCRKNAVLCAAFFAALITSFIVPPDARYLGYFDWKTLTCLFCVLAVVCALKNIHFFYVLAEKIVESFKTLRLAVLALVWITFIGSMSLTAIAIIPVILTLTGAVPSSLSLGGTGLIIVVGVALEFNNQINGILAGNGYAESEL